MKDDTDMLNIKIITLGHIPPSFNKNKIEKHKSKIFKVSTEIQSHSISEDSDIENWAYSEQLLERHVPKLPVDYDFMIIITALPLQFNWYARRLNNNRTVVSLYEVADILECNDIPVENIILRVLYAYSLVFQSHDNKIPVSTSITDYTHDDVRSCLFDMTGDKKDIKYSCSKPIICQPCITKLASKKVAHETIKTATTEIAKHIKKPLFFRLSDLIKKHPIQAICYSTIVAITLGIVGSIIGNFLYDYLTN